MDGQSFETARTSCQPCRDDDAAVAALRYRRTERTSLYIETQEGDVVRLKIKIRDSVEGTATSDPGETTVSELALNARSSVKIRFSVDGELNTDELAAIASIVEQAAALAEDFFSGDVPEAFAAAAALEIDGSELARVGLRFSLREQATYTNLGTYAPAALPTPTPAALAPPVEPVAVANPEAPPTIASGDTPAGAAVVPSVLGEPTTETTPTAEDPSAPATPEPPVQAPLASQTLLSISDFIAHLLEALAAPASMGPGEEPAVSIELSLKLRVFQSIIVHLAPPEPAATEPPGASGVPLAVDTLEALATQQQPLDTRA